MKRFLTVVALYAAANAGAGYLFRQRRREYAGARKHFLVTHGGAQVRPTADDVRDAVVSVMMGGIVLDLRGVEPARRPARLDVLSVMGGVELVVPEDWNVRMDMETVMGGIQDRRPGPVDPGRSPDLVLTGRVVMGGVDVASTAPAEERAMRPRRTGRKVRAGV